MKRGSLTAVGTGIRIVAQTSPEALACIERAEKLYFVAADPLTELWLREINPSAESFHTLYAVGKDRSETYEEMVQCVLGSVFDGRDVCFVSYGHPGVFAYPMHESIRRARAAGYTARMLPAISADACLFADLGIDPGSSGCQSFEASDFLVYRRRFDTRSALILWQIGLIGEWSHRNEDGLWSPGGLALLIETLLRHYDPQHEVTVYEAARYVCSKPVIETVRLAHLKGAKISPLSTLFVPPGEPAVPDLEILERLRLAAAT